MPSNARWGSLLSFFVTQALGAAVLFLILQVQREPLPRDEIRTLAESLGNGSEVPWPRLKLSVSTVAGAFEPAVFQEFAKHLGTALSPHGVDVDAEETPAAELIGLTACVQASTPDAAHAGRDTVIDDCLASLEELASLQPDDGGDMSTVPVFKLLLVPSKGCSALLLDAGTSAVLRWRPAAPLAGPLELATAVATRFRETWFRDLPLWHGTPLFDIAPSYVFSFFLVGDCGHRSSWNFPGGVLLPYLQRFLGRLQQLFDLEVDSQVVQCSALGGKQAGGRVVVDASELKADFQRYANEWPGDTVTRDATWLPPLVRLAAFWPSGKLRVVDDNGQRQHSFAVPGWGAVVLAGADGTPCEKSKVCSRSTPSTQQNHTVRTLSACEAQQIASAWVSHLRAWLTLAPEAPVANDLDGACTADGGLATFAARPVLDGIARWEQFLVARVVHALFVRRAAETLQNVQAMVDSLTELVVKEEIGEAAVEAAAAIRRAASAATLGNLTDALKAARSALKLALTVSHDETLAADLYFSWEFRWAVHLPLILPVVVPTVVAAAREISKLRELSKTKQRLAAEAAAEDVQ